MIDNIFFWIAYNFDTETYLSVSKIQSFFWTIADYLMVLFSLLIVSLYRGYKKQKRIIFRYLVFAGSLFFLPHLLFAKDVNQWMRFELIIVGTQFFIQILTIIIDGKGAFKYVLEEIIKKNKNEVSLY